MVARNRKKSNRKGAKRRLSASQLRKKRSNAAKKGWQTRRHKAFVSREVLDLQDMLEKSRKELEEAKVERDAIRDEMRHIKETGEIAGGLQFPPKRSRPRKEVVKEFMDRAVRLYGSGPGLLDTAHDLAEYYDIEINEIYDEWYGET